MFPASTSFWMPKNGKSGLADASEQTYREQMYHSRRIGADVLEQMYHNRCIGADVSEQTYQGKCSQVDMVWWLTLPIFNRCQLFIQRLSSISCEWLSSRTVTIMNQVRGDNSGIVIVSLPISALPSCDGYTRGVWSQDFYGFQWTFVNITTLTDSYNRDPAGYWMIHDCLRFLSQYPIGGYLTAFFTVTH